MTRRNRNTNRNAGTRRNGFNAEDRWFDDGGQSFDGTPPGYRNQESQGYRYQQSGYPEQQGGYNNQNQFGPRAYGSGPQSQRGTAGQGSYAPNQGGYGQGGPSDGRYEQGQGDYGYSTPRDEFDQSDADQGGFGQGPLSHGQGQQGYGQPQFGYGQGSPSQGGYGQPGYGQGHFAGGQNEFNQRGGGGLGGSGGARSGAGSGQTYERTRGGQAASNPPLGQPFSNIGSGGATEWWTQENAPPRRFVGKGPKGYKRSDERIREDVNDALSDGTIDASNITVAVETGEVTLSGTVESRDMKFYAERLAEQCSGVKDVINQLRVSQSSVSGGAARDDTEERGGSQRPSKSTATAGARS